MACAVATPVLEPSGDFPAWLEAQGVNAEVARAMDSELGIRDYGVLRACVGDGLVRAELLATARDRLPFGFYAVLRQVVKALQGAEHHDAGTPRWDDAASSPGDVTLGGLVEVLLALFSGLSRELLLSVQRLGAMDGAGTYVEPSSPPGEEVQHQDDVTACSAATELLEASECEPPPYNETGENLIPNVDFTGLEWSGHIIKMETCDHDEVEEAVDDGDLVYRERTLQMDPSNGQSSSSAGFIIKDVTSLQDSACQTLTNLSGRYPRARRSAPPRRRPKATITTATTTTTASSSATTSSSFTSSAPASSSTTSGPFSPRSNTALRPIAKRCAPVPTHASTSAPAATNYRTPVASVPKYRPIRPRPMDPSRERSRPFDAAAAAAAAAATIANVAAGPALAEQGSHRYQAVAANCQSAAGTRAPLNLRAFLQRRAPHLFEACQSTGMLSQSSRKELVKLAVSHLVERHGFYPSSVEKTSISQEIIDIFPSQRLDIGDSSVTGHEHFYDPQGHTGFVEVRLRNLRRKLNADQKKFSKRHKRKLEEGGCGMAAAMAVKRSRTLLLDPSDATSDPEQIPRDFQRLVAIPGLLDAEFDKISYGKGRNFVERWEHTYVPKLRRLAVHESEDVKILLRDVEVAATPDEVCFTMLKILTHLLPPTMAGPAKGSKCSIKCALPYLVDFAPVGTSASALLDDAAIFPPRTQPYLVGLGIGAVAPAVGSGRPSYAIVARGAGVALTLRQSTLVGALDQLFKLLWVCGVQYPAQVAPVYGFLEHVYGMPAPRALCRRSKVLELVGKLQLM
ncbi:uncharacterized protein LOC116942309 [Petromyzon marinus]|uniref:Uncharacterized protein LOC116942309 n=1 Tax=Petromyzon marinus TaxID=7757 RepID=A0AAJ7WU61_PETMA|nr:uncharacterized protein LOC116942309 [Petromyzon marinus]XP_032809942.1 uncharacterized protein LOC116942309 [Petromyzon marinus]